MRNSFLPNSLGGPRATIKPAGDPGPEAGGVVGTKTRHRASTGPSLAYKTRHFAMGAAENRLLTGATAKGRAPLFGLFQPRGICRGHGNPTHVATDGNDGCARA